MATEAYITIHDQDLILACEESGQFDLLSHTYMFVGHRPVDRLPEDLKVIVCRDYQPNVEQWPQFYDFTGWWTLTRHRLIEADHTIMLQYDMTIIDPGIEAKVDALLSAAPGMVAFNAGYWGPNWMLHLPEFESTYRAGLLVHNIHPEHFPPFNEWPCTQGTAWRRETLTSFMRWFEPMFGIFKDHIFAGHLAERTVKAYHVVNFPEQYLLGMIAHTAADMHGTGALMGGDWVTYEARNREFMSGVQ
jgi:hypothetical protein